MGAPHQATCLEVPQRPSEAKAPEQQLEVPLGWVAVRRLVAQLRQVVRRQQEE